MGIEYYSSTKIQTMRNFLMQANASEMLRIACYRFVTGSGLDRGFLLAGPVHDALLVECVSEDAPDAAAFTRLVMESASRTVLGGFTLGVDVKVWRNPHRFMDEKRGLPTWRKMMRYLAGAKRQSVPYMERQRIQNEAPVQSPYYYTINKNHMNI